MLRRNRWLAAAGLAISTLGPVAVSQAQALLNSSFTYQGQLKSGVNLVETLTDFRFTLVDTGGGVIAGPITRSNVTVRDGVFTVSLDFGFDVFQGDERLLKIEVRNPAGAGSFKLLSPNQPMTAAPYALLARRGEVPWVVNEPGSTNSVTISPDNTGFFPGPITTRIGGNQSQNLGGINGDAGGEANLSLTTGGLITFVGGDARDKSGFGSWLPVGGGISDGTAEIDADIDNDSTNGISEGGVRLSSVGTGGGGGSLRLSRNGSGRTNTLEARGGTDTGGANLQMFNGDSGIRVVSLAENFTATPGGRLHLTRPDGGFQFDLEPDFSTGGGAFFSMGGNTTGAGSLSMQTNNGSGDTLVFFSGAGSSFSVNTSASNTTSAVNMTGNAVDSGEIFDEPGVANNHVSSTAMPAATGTLISRSITVPGPGFVVVLAQGDIAVTHTSGNNDITIFGVSDAAGTLPGDQDIQFHVPSGLATGTYDSSAAAHGLFSVGAAGTFTYFFNGRTSGGSPATMFDINLTLMYFPTAYGSTVSNFTGGFRQDNTNHGPVGQPLTADELAAERAMGEEFGRARIAREFTEMQAKMDALKKQVDAMNANQSIGKPAPKRAPEPANKNVPATPIASNTEGK